MNELNIAMSLVEQTAIDGVIKTREESTQLLKAWGDTAKMAVMLGSKKPSETLADLTQILLHEQILVMKLTKLVEEAEHDITEKYMEKSEEE